MGRDPVVLRAVLDVLDDQRTRLELQNRIGELDDAVRSDFERIDEVLFSDDDREPDGTVP